VNKKRILHIIDSLTIGGAEKLLVGTINGLPGFDHHLIYLGGSDSLLKYLPAGAKVIKLHYKSKVDIPRCVIRVRQYIRQNNIEVLHSHMVMASLIARIACPTDVQLFVTLHSMVGSRFFGSGKLIPRLAEKLTYKKRHHVIAVSDEVCRDYDHHIGIKGAWSVLPNFVEDHFFQQGLKQMNFHDSFRMITVGNLKPAKNHTYLIEAFKKLPGNIQLDIFGDGPLRKHLQEQISKYKLNIKLCGVSNNVHELMHSYDLFIMSSAIEGHPLALLEAMACGMPVAVSDIPVLREATAGKAIYFDLNNVDDFVMKVNDIADHKIDLDGYARVNFEIALKIAAKDRYIARLKTIYSKADLCEPIPQGSAFLNKGGYIEAGAS
jgi:glycosyltransferase involved in cell wall biosynthesis